MNHPDWNTLVLEDASNPPLQRLWEESRTLPPETVWKKLQSHFSDAQTSLEDQQRLFRALFESELAPVWIPDSEFASQTHVGEWMAELCLDDYKNFYEWSVDHREDFWKKTVEKLGINFKTEASQVFSPLGNAYEYFKGAKLNIAQNCFAAPPDQTAIVFLEEDGKKLQSVSYKDLERQSNQFANGLIEVGVNPGDAIAIDMPMTVESVVAYLGILKMGAAVVSIADSFAPPEISTRLRISKARWIVTQKEVRRSGKIIPLYERVCAANAPSAIVVAESAENLREGDRLYSGFLSSKTEFNYPGFDSDSTINLLFSSGTTGDPKAIPWSQTTPIKCAMDGYFHQNISAGDVVAWPTNLGWMMGPWLIFASLLNRATMALYYGTPNGEAFGKFVQDANVTMLGLVPSMVKNWRQTKCMERFDWSHIQCFSSTGECSNASDYFYLMALAGYRPIVEYCGGTEIGGGYMTQSLVQPAIPGTFSTPALGLGVCLLDEEFSPVSKGELFLLPPSLGLSSRLLNRDHDEVYFSDIPKGSGLRRHGDEFELLPNGYFRGHGRVDDTMNLGGIKVSSADIERVVNSLDMVLESAAVAVTPSGGGPSELVLFLVTSDLQMDPILLKAACQKIVKSELNPLFRVSAIRTVESLPRTASNKVMRRVLRDRILVG